MNAIHQLLASKICVLFENNSVQLNKLLLVSKVFNVQSKRILDQCSVKNRYQQIQESMSKSEKVVCISSNMKELDRMNRYFLKDLGLFFFVGNHCLIFSSVLDTSLQLHVQLHVQLDQSILNLKHTCWNWNDIECLLVIKDQKSKNNLVIDLSQFPDIVVSEKLDSELNNQNFYALFNYFGHNYQFYLNNESEIRINSNPNNISIDEQRFFEFNAKLLHVFGPGNRFGLFYDNVHKHSPNVFFFDFITLKQSKKIGNGLLNGYFWILGHHNQTSFYWIKESYSLCADFKFCKQFLVFSLRMNDTNLFEWNCSSESRVDIKPFIRSKYKFVWCPYTLSNYPIDFY